MAAGNDVDGECLKIERKKARWGGGDLVGNLILEYLDLPKSLY